MKKTMTILAALLMGAAAMQAKPADLPDTTLARERLERIENAAEDTIKKKLPSRDREEAEGLFSFDAVKRFGAGYLGTLDSEVLDTKSYKSREIWFNALELGLNPAQWLSFTLGVDLKWDSIIAGDKWFVSMDDERNFTFTDIDLVKDPEVDYKCFVSKVNMFSLTLPAALELKFGSFALRAGAEAAYCLSGKAVQKISYGNSDTATKLKKGNVPSFYWDAFAEILIDDIGIYCKYCPEELIPGTGMRSFSLGLVLGF
ncbi:MAG: hypothetical protein K6C31_05475 [Bacteroidales bacterium]|nr:hypothetical protein [Bacteroidales bacterium]